MNTSFRFFEYSALRQLQGASESLYKMLGYLPVRSCEYSLILSVLDFVKNSERLLESIAIPDSLIDSNIENE